MVLSWLPVREDWDSRLLAAKSLAADVSAPVLRELATSRMEVSQLTKLIACLHAPCLRMKTSSSAWNRFV